MKLRGKQTNIQCLENFRVETDYRFNFLSPGRAFRHDLQGLVVGGEEGIIRIYDLSLPLDVKKPQITLETKGGPIQTIAVHDVTKFYNDDLVIGDSYGTLTVFCNQQILCRHSIASDSIRCLQIHCDQGRQIGHEIITSDYGVVTVLRGNGPTLIFYSKVKFPDEATAMRYLLQTWTSCLPSKGKPIQERQFLTNTAPVKVFFSYYVANLVQIDKKVVGKLGCLLLSSAGNSCIVTSDESGYITALLPSKQLWKININNQAFNKGLEQKTVITCLLSTELTSQNGEKCSYILAADNGKHLHFVNQGDIVMTINTPSVVTAMCAGVFIDSDKLETSDLGPVKDRTQVALGCSSGAIYILHNFQITEEEYGNANYKITQLKSHPKTGSRLDYILCSGHFNAIQVYHDGKKVGSHETTDWINSLAVTSFTKDKKQQIIAGCLDNTIVALTLIDT